MQLVTQAELSRYLADDSIAAMRSAFAAPDDVGLTCQRWLDESPAKRLVFDRLYGDLLRGERRLRVLDVGGGFTSFTRELARRHDYVLVDLLAHDAAQAEAFREVLGPLRFHVLDWYDYQPDSDFDVVIANDLFPNVDQRLPLFLSRFLPRTREIRLSLTYYETPRFYLARRLDGDEVLCMLAWNGALTRAALEPFAARIREPHLELLAVQQTGSVYPNGRQVCLVTLNGLALKARRASVPA
jgi:SAM-dependent methyltransferase